MLSVKKENDLLKSQILRLKKEQQEKDFYLLQIKKSMDFGGTDKKLLMLKYEDIEKANDHLNKEKEYLMKEIDQIKGLNNKKQTESEEMTKLNNILQDKEKSLINEIDEIRGLLSNSFQIK